MLWSFWGTGHGKGPHDGVGACLKQCIRKEQLKPDARKLHNATDVVAYLREAMNLGNAAYPKAKRVVHRNFREIGEEEVVRTDPLDCKTIPGSRSMHCIRSVSHSNHVLLECRDFSCFCDHYYERVPGECSNKSHVSPWKLLTLEPVRSTNAVQETKLEAQQDWTGEADDNYIASQLQVGDNFAVPAELGNTEGVDFYVVQCTRTMHIVEETSRRDVWDGKVVERGDKIVEGLYYQRKGLSQTSYILLRDKGVSFHYSHLILTLKFRMVQARHKQKGDTTVYQMSENSLQRIRAVLQNREQLEELESASDAATSSDIEDDDCFSESDDEGGSTDADDSGTR
jgi:hypothetical protein